MQSYMHSGQCMYDCMENCIRTGRLQTFGFRKISGKCLKQLESTNTNRPTPAVYPAGAVIFQFLQNNSILEFTLKDPSDTNAIKLLTRSLGGW